MHKYTSGPCSPPQQMRRRSGSSVGRMRWFCRMLWPALSLAVLLAIPRIARAQTCTFDNFQGVPTGTLTVSTTISVTATCPPIGVSGPATSNINWGEASGPSGSQVVSSGSSPYTATHTYPTNSSLVYRVLVSSFNSYPYTSSTDVARYVSFPSSPSAVFSGRQAVVSAAFASDVQVSVNVSCPTVIDPSGVSQQASTYNITCSLQGGPQTLPANPRTLQGFGQPQSPVAGQNLTVVITTNGVASRFGLLTSHAPKALLACLAVPGLLLLNAGFRKRSSTLRRGLSACVMLVLALNLTACGGGFDYAASAMTSPGIYLIKVDTSATSTTSGFVQNTLLVPLYVGPAQ